MKVTLIGKTQGILNVPAQAAAICYDSVNAASSLKGALSSGHESVIEHQSYTFHIEGVSRVLLAQLTRHRIASYSVQSQRYCGVDKQDIVMPPSIADDEELAEEYTKVVRYNRKFYEYMTKLHNIPAEDARYITPQGITTDLVMTMNARELKHFLRLRMCNRAQWEIRALADAIYKIAYKEDPVLFSNAGPGCCTKHGCPEGKKCCGRPRNKELDQMKQDIVK